ncbi:MAG: hypothetical protein KF902_01700 [Phycisphaeraceae bacterium]|nr:hypothetical protein [Phycisphaeraceae bacterium]
MPRTREIRRTASATLHASPAALESLESRVVLAATEIAAVGLSYDFSQFDPEIPPTYRSYTLLGSVSDENVMRYRMRWDGAAGAGPASPVRDAQLVLTDNGAFRYQTPYWTSGSSTGAQFLPEDGYTVGWWRGHKMKDDIVGDTPYVAHSEEQFIVAVGAPTMPFAAALGNYRFSMIERDTQTGIETIRTGRIAIQRGGDERNVTFYEAATDRLLFQTSVTSWTGGSRFTTSAGQQFFLSADGSTLIFADVASGDRSIHAGVAVRIDREATAEEVAGTYHILQRGRYSRESISWTLTLSPDGTFESRGEYVSSDHGSWFVYKNSEIVLRSDSGSPESRYVISTSGAGLLHIGASVSPPRLAFGTRATIAPSRSDPVLGVPSVGADGEGLVFIDRTNAPWTVTDVAEASGGPRANGPLLTWFDSRTGLARAAASTDRGLTVYSELANGMWTFEVLGETLGTGTVLRPEIATTTGPGGSRNIVGLSTEGDLIRYVLPRSPGASWNEWNLSENQLDWRGLATPQYIGRIVATATSWGGLNIAGIDSSGHLVTVWTSLTAGRWYISNLSEYAGVTSPLTGLDVAAAGSRGIHFSAINASGKITIVSWKPGDAYWNATTFEASPAMKHDEMSIAFDPRTGSLYIATARLDSGSLILHTVSLLLPPPTTPWVTVSGFGVPIERRVVRVLDVRIDATGIISVFTINPADETTRFTSLFSLNTDWGFENITDLAR